MKLNFNVQVMWLLDKTAFVVFLNKLQLYFEDIWERD